MEPDRRAIRRSLLAWYARAKRDLPFRRTRDPYAILVAEVMLQRTRISAGLPYYERFLAAFPTVSDLADASEQQVLRRWEGLGFYRRARNLHQAARAIVREHGGRVPEDPEALRSLPGIGDYTAGAVASIAFGVPVPAVDGNASRVLARVFRLEGDPSRGPWRRRLLALAAEIVPRDAPGTWNQAVMELGSTVCTPRVPRCGACPIHGECLSALAGVQERVPRRSVRAPVPTVPVVFAVVERGRDVLLLRRAEGLHAGLHALPGGDVLGGESEADAVARHLGALGLVATRTERIGTVRHAFSHLRWEGTAFRARVRGTPRRGSWVPRERTSELPLVPLHRRLLAHVKD